MTKKRKTSSISIGEPKRRFLKTALVIAVGAVIAVSTPVRAQVPPGAVEVWPTDALATIQAAVDGGGVVYFHSGAYSWAGILNINNSVKLTGPKPIGDFNTKTGTDNRVWEAKITKSPAGTDVWNPPDPIIQVNCPGNTENVLISNLDIECLSSGMCILLQGGGDSITISSCRTKTVDDGYGIITWEAGAVSVVVEDCYIEAGTEGFVYPDGTPPNTDCMAFGMSNFATIEVRNNIAINNCDTLDSSTAVELVWHQEPNTQVTISNNWLKSAGEGFAIFYFDSACPIGTVSRNTVSGNFHFLHMDNSGSGGKIENNRFECGDSGMVSFYFKDTSGVIVQDNTFKGSASMGGIGLVGDSSHNVFVGNNMSNLIVGEIQLPVGASPLGDAAHLIVGADCHDNMFARNVIGSLGPGASAAVHCSGDNNDFVRNNYTQSGIPGLTAGEIPCVLLANTFDPATGDLVAEPENNLVFELMGFPTGTSTVDQVLDQPRELGSTTNIVVGH